MGSDDSGHYTEVISSKVSAATKDRMDSFKEDDETRSAAVRRLIRIGLDVEEGKRPPSLSRALLIGVGVNVVAAFFYVPALFAALGNYLVEGPIYWVLIFGGLLYPLSTIIFLAWAGRIFYRRATE